MAKVSAGWRGMLAAMAVLAGALVSAPALAVDSLTESLGRLPFIADPKLSPTGEYVAMRQVVDGTYTVVVYDLNSDEPPFGWETPAYSEIVDYQWVAEDRLLVDLVRPDFHFGRRGRRIEFGVGLRVEAHIIDPDGGNPVELYNSFYPGAYLPGPTQIIDPMWDDRHHILYSPIEPQGRPALRGEVYREISPEQLRSGTDHTMAWLVDHDGNLRLRVDAENNEIRVYIKRTPRSGWRRILDARPLEEASFVPLAFAADNNAIYVMSNHEDRTGLYRINLENPDVLERVFLHDRVDMSGVLFNGLTFEPSAIQYTDDFSELAYLDDEFASLNRRLGRSLPGPDVAVINSAALGGVHVVRSGGPSTPPEFYILNEHEGTLQLIETAYRFEEGVRFGRVQPVSYQARDGLTIHGYLTYPPDPPEGPLSMVVLPHGGPHVRDVAEFDTIAHLLAASGHVVFQMNFRGSTGYGLSFQQAGYREWGGAMQDDLTDGIDEMIARGIADPDRICLVGLSYGAYAVMLEAVRHPDRFACVAGVAGVYDLPSMMETPQGQMAENYLNVTLGDADRDRRRLEGISPQFLLPDHLPPIFLGHGQRDYTVPVEQTEGFVTELNKDDYEVQLRYYQQSAHSFQFERERIQMYGDLRAFVDGHLIWGDL